MNEQLKLAMAMLTIFLSAVLVMTGSFYLERADKRDTHRSGAALTQQADVREGFDIRLVSERDPYMRSER